MNYSRQSGYFQFEENFSSKGAQGIAFIMHKTLLLRKFLQTKPQVECMNINYFDLYYTIIENLSVEGGEN